MLRLPRYQAFIICALLLLAVAMVFGQTARHEFILCDDDPYIQGNPHVNTGLTWNNVKWAMTAVHAGNWHPLTWMSHMCDCAMFGSEQEGAGWHHLVGATIHAASAIILFLALWQMTDALWLSAIAAAMFAIHPLRAESVAWAAERKDVLSGLFWMLTLLAYGWYVRRPGVGRYLAIVGCFALGLMSKSMLVTLPCILLLLDVWPLRRLDLSPPRPAKPRSRQTATPDATANGASLARRAFWLVLEKVPLFAMSAAVSAIIIVGQKKFGAMNMAGIVPLHLRVANAAMSYVAYIGKTILPVNLAFFYPYPAIASDAPTTWMIWDGLLAAMLLAAITIAVLWSLRRRPYLAVGWFWYLIAALPVIGLIQVGVQSMADRYTYLPTIGLYLMAVWGGAEWATRRPAARVPLAAGAALLLLMWVAMAIEQVATWRNSEAVFSHAIQVTKDNYFAYNHLGLTYYKMSGYDSPIPRERLVNPNSERYRRLARENYLEAVRTGPKYDSANGNLGVYYSRMDEPEKAIEYYRRAVEVNPYAAVHHMNLAASYLNRHEFNKAEAEYRRIIEIEPEEPEGHGLLSAMLLLQGKTTEADAERRKALKLCTTDLVRYGMIVRLLGVLPKDVELLNEAAWIRATSADKRIRNARDAVPAARLAVKMTQGEDPAVLGTLAAAYASDGRFDNAVEVAERAAKLADQQQKPNLAKSIRAKLALYQAGKPYLESSSNGDTSQKP